jgi:two-component sensor histidine kinase
MQKHKNLDHDQDSAGVSRYHDTWSHGGRSMPTSIEPGLNQKSITEIGRRSTSLLDLLRPDHPGSRSSKFGCSSANVAGEGRHALWAADAHHRATNFTQMFASLQNLAPVLDLALDPGAVQRHAATLSSAYAAIATDGPDDILLPCTPILRDVIVGLTTLFVEDAGAFILRLSLDELWLPKDKRRALILIASELVINTVKYAFPAGRAGELSITLTRHGDVGALTVQDDGIGMPQGKEPGNGTHLLDQLSGLIGGAIERDCPGRGLRVQVVFNPW